MSDLTAIEVRVPKQSMFDLSHDVKMTLEMGKLIPTQAILLMPNDFVTWKIEILARSLAYLAPVMHKVNITTFHFFVPKRILWNGFEKWITGEEEGLPPMVNLPTLPAGSLGDYLGYPLEYATVPLDGKPAVPFTAWKTAAYIKIWNEHFRDQNLQSEVPLDLVAGTENDGIFDTLADPPFFRAWMHDYFTAGLPFAQKGDAVTLPLTQQERNYVQVGYENDPENIPFPHFRNVIGTAVDPTGSLGQSIGVSSPYIRLDGEGAIDRKMYDPDDTLYIDINAEAVDITSLRTAFALQRYLEKNARGGTRYIEFNKVQYGAISSDSRLQRPEFIGSTMQSMVISEVLSTAETVDTEDETVNVVGNMAGHGISANASQKFRYKAEEHGILMTLVNVQPITAYGQGIHKSDLYFDPLDYPIPDFQHIGEQEVMLQELFVNSEVYDADTPYIPTKRFSYMPRYAEARYMNSRVAGDFRPNESLEYWTFGRKFDTEPALNSDFIKCVPSQLPFAVTAPGNRNVLMFVLHRMKKVTALSKYGTPH